MSISTKPSSAQKLLMETSWNAQDINTTDRPGIIGMFGNRNGWRDKEYFFYMEFSANALDTWWETDTNKQFILLF